jgi:hypothetical protein
MLRRAKVVQGPESSVDGPHVACYVSRQERSFVAVYEICEMCALNEIYAFNEINEMCEINEFYAINEINAFYAFKEINAINAVIMRVNGLLDSWMMDWVHQAAGLPLVRKAGSMPLAFGFLSSSVIEVL